MASLRHRLFAPNAGQDTFSLGDLLLAGEEGHNPQLDALDSEPEEVEFVGFDNQVEHEENEIEPIKDEDEEVVEAPARQTGQRKVGANRKPRSRVWLQQSDPHRRYPHSLQRVAELGSVEQSAITLGQGENACRNLLAIFEDLDDKPRLAFNILLAPNRAKDRENLNYPRRHVILPVGLSLDEMCSIYPNHVHGDGLRLFITEEGWNSGERIWRCLPQDFRLKGAATRPWNYLQQNLARENDLTLKEDGKTRKPIKRTKRSQPRSVSVFDIEDAVSIGDLQTASEANTADNSSPVTLATVSSAAVADTDTDAGAAALGFEVSMPGHGSGSNGVPSSVLRQQNLSSTFSATPTFLPFPSQSSGLPGTPLNMPASRTSSPTVTVATQQNVAAPRGAGAGRQNTRISIPPPMDYQHTLRQMYQNISIPLDMPARTNVAATYQNRSQNPLMTWQPPNPALYNRQVPWSVAQTYGSGIVTAYRMQQPNMGQMPAPSMNVQAQGNRWTSQVHGQQHWGSGQQHSPVQHHIGYAPQYNGRMSDTHPHSQIQRTGQPRPVGRYSAIPLLQQRTQQSAIWNFPPPNTQPDSYQMPTDTGFETPAIGSHDSSIAGGGLLSQIPEPNVFDDEFRMMGDESAATEEEAESVVPWLDDDLEIIETAVAPVAPVGQDEARADETQGPLHSTVPTPTPGAPSSRQSLKRKRSDDESSSSSKRRKRQRPAGRSGEGALSTTEEDVDVAPLSPEHMARLQRTREIEARVRRGERLNEADLVFYVSDEEVSQIRQQFDGLVEGLRSWSDVEVRHKWLYEKTIFVGGHSRWKTAEDGAKVEQRQKNRRKRNSKS